MRERRANNMPKQLNVDLRFNADTSQAKKQIQDLQQTLSKLGTDSIKSLNFDKMNSELLEANQNVNKLKAQLTSAFNTNTGKLDLTKFTQEMERSGMSLEKYQKSLMALGPEGSKAFAELANSIAAADIPLMRTNKLLTEMGTVLKNTIKWQISSSAIHGFMGAIQQAYGYAQDLNESLTNIQIVTQYDSKYMADFAERANKAAQALSTTTTAYTDAALIFYQQGLDDKSVEERTNATIKMAQVTGDSAQEVSSYMTAIWNNFDDGSQSLEHYADVITALGAATASSSAEISQGLEKFASIADTVGLSYEYATTALATVVAQTRQSADVVGTAFKTMFARIQDLELGKTLEDGVDLGQYSKALAKVGVDVMDANGQLRAMDDILDDIGQKWGELGEAERVALAQNVAGQRQYAQFMAIFENWGTFQENLSVANTANGALQEQADIYAESWEASQKRVKAAMEGIYQSIIDDKFFIKVNDFLSDNINGVNNLIKAMGGLPGILTTIGALVTRFLGPQMANGLRDMATNVMMLTSAGREKVKGQQLEVLTRAQSGFAEDTIESQIYKEKLKYQQVYLENAEKISELDNLSLKFQQEQLDALGKETIELEKQSKELEQQISKKQSTMSDLARTGGVDQAAYSKARQAYASRTDYLMESGVQSVSQGYQLNELFTELKSAQSGTGNIKAIKAELKDLALQFNITEEQKKKLDKILNTPTTANEAYTQMRKMFEELGVDIGGVEIYAKQCEVTYEKLITTLTSGEVTTEQAREAVQEYSQALEQHHEINQKIKQDMENISAGYSEMGKKAKISAAGIQDWAQKVVTGAQAMTTLAMTLTSLKGMFQTLTDENMSFGDKLLSVMTTLGMVIPMIGSLANAINVQTVAQALNVKVTEEATVAELAAAVADKVRTIGIMGVVKALGAQAAATLAAYWPVLLLVAALAALVKAFEYATNAFNKEAIAAQKAKEAATNLAEAYNEAKDACEQFKRTASDYTSAKNALTELTKGTQEYTDTLLAANEAAMQLLETGRITSEQYHFEDGLMVIDDSALDNAQSIMQQNALNLQASSQMASAYAQQMQNQADLVAIRRSDNSWYNGDVARATGAVLADALTFGHGGDFAHNALMSGEWTQEAEIQRIAELYQSIGEGAFAGSELFQNATEDMQEAIRNYCKQVQQADTLTQAYADQIAHANLNVEEFGEAAIEFASSQYVEDYNQAYQDALEDTRDHINQASTENDPEARRLWQRYQQATGITASLHGVEGTDSNRSFTYLDEEGNLQHVYAEQMASALAAAEAVQHLGESAQQAANFLNRITDENQHSVLEQMFANFSNGRVNASQFAGNVLSGTNIDVTDLMNYWTGEGEFDEEALGLQMGQVLDAYGITNEQLVEFAERTESYAGDIQRDLVEGLLNEQNAFNEYLDNRSTEARNLRDTTSVGQLNNDAARIVLDFFENARRSGVGDTVSDLMSNMSSDEAERFAQTLSQVDWNSINSSQLLQMLNEADVPIEGFEGALVELCNQLRVVTADTVTAAAEYYNALEKIANGLTDQSDTISAADWAALQK